jgi:hypothetical protein
MSARHRSLGRYARVHVSLASLPSPTENPDCACVVACVAEMGIAGLVACQMECGVAGLPPGGIELSTCHSTMCFAAGC